MQQGKFEGEEGTYYLCARAFQRGVHKGRDNQANGGRISGTMQGNAKRVQDGNGGDKVGICGRRSLPAYDEIC